MRFFYGVFKIIIVILILVVLWAANILRQFSNHSIEFERKSQLVQKAQAKYLNYVNEICLSFVKEMRNEFHLSCRGNTSRMHEKIEEFGMEFDTFRRATIEEARALQLLVMDKFIKKINNHEKIQPFLDESPITFKRVSIKILFEGPNGSYTDGSVAYIFNVSDLAGAIENRNHLFYVSIDPFTGNHIDHFEESIEEALKLVSTSKIEMAYFHKTTPIERAFDQTLSSYAQEMEEEYGFKCSSIGGKIPGSVEEIGASFFFVHSSPLEEARKIILVATKRLIQAIDLNAELRPFLSEFPFRTNRIKLRICFRERNYGSIHDESIESATLENDTISYFRESTERSSIRLIHTPLFFQESYQEALSVLKTSVNKNLRKR